MFRSATAAVARLLAPHQPAAIAVVPDPIADLPRLWPHADLAEDYRCSCSRKGMSAETRLLALHVRNRSMKGLSRHGSAPRCATSPQRKG